VISGVSCEDSVPAGHLVKETAKVGIGEEWGVQAQSPPFRRPLMQLSVKSQMEIPLHVIRYRALTGP
jgi:hypothetical protein